MAKVIVGLDIGTTKIACFVGTKNEHGKIDILSMGTSESIGVRRGMVSNIEQTVQSIQKAVQEAQQRVEGELTIRVVNVGIAGQHIKSLQHRGIYTRNETDSLISQVDIDALIEDMYRLVMVPGEEIIDVLPQEFIVDNESGIKTPIGMPGTRLEANFHIITGNVAAVLNVNRCVKSAGLEVRDIILEPIASSDAVLSEEEKEAGIVLVDIGGGTTDLAIFHEGIIRHTAVIPFGGNIITEDIKEGCSIMKHHAEMLKTKFGCALISESQENEIVCIPGLKGHEPKEISIRNLASIIQARMQEIVEFVYSEIRNSGYEKKLMGGIVITGGGAQLKHVAQLFEYICGMDSRVGYPTEHLAPGSHIENLTSPMYSTGIGLVLKGFESLEKIGAKKPILENEKDDLVRKKTTFFDKIMEKTRSIFEEEK